MPLNIVGFGEESEIHAQSLRHPDKSPTPAKDPPRVVLCYDCQNVHKVSAASTSSLCPNCGQYIDLRDVVIKERSSQRIKTRGDVVVEKKATLMGTSITCGNLTVHGQISGSIYASGTVHFNSLGKVLGEIRCKRLFVEKKSQIQFLQPVHAEVAEIHGEAVGNFFCGTMILAKTGKIQGNIHTRNLKMEKGAGLMAKVEIRPSEAKPQQAAHITPAATEPPAPAPPAPTQQKTDILPAPRLPEAPPAAGSMPPPISAD